MLDEVVKSCKKMISTDTKADVKREIKELVAVSYNFQQKLKNLKYNIKQDCIFNLIFVGTQFSLLSAKNMGTRGILLNSLNLLSMAKAFC